MKSRTLEPQVGSKAARFKRIGRSTAALAAVGLMAWALRASEIGRLPKLWRSETTGNQYRVELAGNVFRADWITLPAALAKQGAFLRTECHRKGEKWVGTSSSRLPCDLGQGATEHLARLCNIETRTEIDSISPERITGHGETLKKVDCGTCKVLATGWAAWSWVPTK